MKSAVSEDATSANEPESRTESNLGELKDENEASSKSNLNNIVSNDQLSELDLDSAAIPAATNRQRLSCLSKASEGPIVVEEINNMDSNKQSTINYQAQYVQPPALSPTGTTSTKAATKRNLAAGKQKQTVSKQASSSNQPNNTQFFASTLVPANTTENSYNNSRIFFINYMGLLYKISYLKYSKSQGP